jgi:hypothetical protein
MGHELRDVAGESLWLISKHEMSCAWIDQYPTIAHFRCEQALRAFRGIGQNVK